MPEKIPSHYGKVGQLRHCQSDDESRGRVVSEHDGDQHEAPDEESNAEQHPDQQQQLDLLASANDQEDVGQGIPVFECQIGTQTSSTLFRSHHGKKQKSETNSFFQTGLISSWKASFRFWSFSRILSAVVEL